MAAALQMITSIQPLSRGSVVPHKQTQINTYKRVLAVFLPLEQFSPTAHKNIHTVIRVLALIVSCNLAGHNISQAGYVDHFTCWIFTFPPPGLTDLQRDLRCGLHGAVVPQLAPPLAAVAGLCRDAEEGGLGVQRRPPRRDPPQPQLGGQRRAQAAGQVGRLAGHDRGSGRGDDWAGQGV